MLVRCFSLGQKRCYNHSENEAHRKSKQAPHQGCLFSINHNLGTKQKWMARCSQETTCQGLGLLLFDSTEEESTKCWHALLHTLCSWLFLFLIICADRWLGGLKVAPHHFKSQCCLFFSYQKRKWEEFKNWKNKKRATTGESHQYCRLSQVERGTKPC